MTESLDPRVQLGRMGVSVGVVAALGDLDFNSLNWVIAACYQARAAALREVESPKSRGCRQCRHYEVDLCYLQGQGRFLPTSQICASWEAAPTCNT